MRIGKIANSAESRMDEQFQIVGAIIGQFFEPNVSFQIWKSSRILLIFQFGQFQKFSIWKISKIPDLKNSKNS